MPIPCRMMWRTLSVAVFYLVAVYYLAGFLLSDGSQLAAQQICGPALAACDLQTDNACLERTYSCGEYDTIVETLFVEDFAPTDDQKYFIGASFFGKHIRERSAGLQCEMVKFGRDYLIDYLSTKELQFADTGSFGSMREMDQLYHATQMLTALNDISGCQESGLTRARIQAVARSEGVRFSKNVFLNPPSEARDAFDTLVLSLRSFVSRASDLETGLALRRVEIRSAGAHLQTIRGVFGEIFGIVSGSGTSVAVDTSVLDELDLRMKSMLRDVEVEEAAFAAALGGVSAEQYAEIRAATVANAEAFLKSSAFHINMVGILLPTDPARPFWQLAATVNADDPARSARRDLDQIASDWAAYGDLIGTCGQPGHERVWYCR